jgi:hypothetical protein
MAHTVSALLLCVPFASGETITPSWNTQQTASGTTPTLQSANMSIINCSFRAQTNLCASTGSVVEVAQPAPTMNITCVQGASPPPMEPSTALRYRQHFPVCPYNSVAWHYLLLKHDFLDKYHRFPDGFRNSFSLHLPLLTSCQTPPNHPSLLLYHMPLIIFSNMNSLWVVTSVLSLIRTWKLLLAHFKRLLCPLFPKRGDQTNIELFKTFIPTSSISSFPTTVYQLAG